jgi:hypothetical protein
VETLEDLPLVQEETVNLGMRFWIPDRYLRVMKNTLG